MVNYVCMSEFQLRSRPSTNLQTSVLNQRLRVQSALARDETMHPGSLTWVWLLLSYRKVTKKRYNGTVPLLTSWLSFDKITNLFWCTFDIAPLFDFNLVTSLSLYRGRVDCMVITKDYFNCRSLIQSVYAGSYTATPNEQGASLLRVTFCNGCLFDPYCCPRVIMLCG